MNTHDTELALSTPFLDESDSKPTSSFLGRLEDRVTSFFSTVYSLKNTLYILSGPIVAILIWRFLHIDSDSTGNAVPMVAVMSWVFIWWVTEAIPIAVTALAPLFLLPFLQIRTATEVSKSYMNDTIFLLIGSFILAAAVERYDLHKRMALKMLVVLGGKRMDPWLLLLGFCMGPAFVSMWIHNTAAAVMMMPVGLGVLQKAGSTVEYEDSVGMVSGTKSAVKIVSNSTGTKGDAMMTMDDDDEDEGSATMEGAERRRQRDKKHVQNFSKAVVLAIGYAATLGGMSTLTGTGVNLILAGLYESSFPEAEPITYLQWLMFGLPLAVAMLCFLWLLLCFWFCPRSSVPSIARSLHGSHVHEELASLGPMSFAEIAVLGVFGALVVLWLTKSIGTNIGGWGDLFNDYPGNGTVSVLMATTLFIIPNRRRAGEKLMSWSQCKGIPWGIILLLGGGFALADGMSDSGLSTVISEELDFLQVAPYVLITPIIGILTGAMTEFTSNNSTATIFVSLVAQVATSIGRHPLFLMVPAAIGAQFSYMLPIATPPNAVTFSSGYVSTLDMVAIGFILKFVGIILLSVFMPTLGAVVFKTNTS
ncbi:hypothetical protein L7F22_036428 [Adiantum nelumboides]|nr:hypothetical protein [Adiantum nelumboides]